ncbi:hypothetical protein B5X24_HaOG216419 [Helicoverpa armigera]|nr:hypothetical protein B5X24_HaOG216419 [Helicoverpa armigera]
MIVSQRCLASEEPGCLTTSTTTTTTTVVPPVNSTTGCTADDSWSKPDPTSCEHFELCMHGRMIHKKCPDGLEFSATEYKCLPKSEAGCPVKSKTTQALPMILSRFKEDPEVNCTGSSETPVYFIEDPNDCRRYYICSSGNAVAQTCPDGFFFSDRRQICLPSHQVQCKNLCPNDITQFVADPYDKTRYYICFNGIPLPQICPADYKFDPDVLICVKEKKKIKH